MADVSLPANASLGNWTDVSGFDQLRAQAQRDGKSMLPAVAKQFEALFTQMMLKSMREAADSFGSGLGDSDTGKTWRGMFDQQLALNLSNSGRGLGIAQMLVRQLGGADAAAGAGIGDPAQLPASADEFRARLGDVVQAGRDVARSAMQSLPQDAQAFVRTLAPYAQAAARRLGVSVRSVLAQAALETQWGQRMPRAADGTPSFNLFGIKAGGSWGGNKVSVPTLEYEDGVAVRRRAQFRAYDTPAQSFADYADLIGGSPRYAAVRGHGDDVRGFADALVRGGYATDPAYADKVAAVAESPTMQAALAALKNAPELPKQ